MFSGNFKMAMNSLRTAKWRSLLTMMGIIIGVTSVVVTVSLGEGVKQQVSQQINQLGTDQIIVRPGKLVNRDAGGNITGVNITAAFGANSLTEKDTQAMAKVPGVSTAVPLSVITGVATYDGREYTGGYILATTAELPTLLNQKVQYGSFFSESESKKNFAVIGNRVAQDLFQDSVPVGRIMHIRGQEVVVIGILEPFSTNSISATLDFNNAIILPYEAGKALSGEATQIYEVIIKPTDPKQSNKVADNIKQALLENHAGQEDFTILKQAETLAITSSLLDLLTTLIAGIAAISLLVGGIGIMNIMLVSVSERTREIGIRKAVGATNRQVLHQFMIEAMVLSLSGGTLGVLLAILINFAVRIATNLKPVVSLSVIGIALGISLFVGILFGVFPALRASHKDPIEALRGE